MLLKPSLVGKIIAVKLMNGEEIIARMKSHEGDFYTFTNPVVLTLVPTGNGNAAVSFAAFSMGISEHAEYEIHRDRMLFTPIEARDDAEKQYVKATSGIEIVSSSGLVL